MKRITKLEIENFRAFIDNYKIELPKGENLLVYGENGSGKSSLFKAMNNYLSSSRNAALPFIKNHYSFAPEGKISITFQDFTENPFQPVAGTEQDFVFGSDASNNNVQFVKDSDLIKGFLDYKSLLDVYYHKEPNPNLFELIVFTLLGEHIPIGSNYEFRGKWNQLQEDLIDNSYTRNDRTHQNALAELPVYENFLQQTLTPIFGELNRLLATYFPDLKIHIGFTLQGLTFNYGPKLDWYTTADLRLQVMKDGELIVGDYSDILNEARLSAFALCLYLASLLLNPEDFDLKILFLDDVFIGLDASNRIPILKILQQEFLKYQIYIATYDRHLYELAKRQFETETPGKWKTVEFYVGKDRILAQDFEKPIIVNGDSNFERGIQYLHDRIKPDYPAAANYFRKTLEEIIQQFVPKWETADLENSNQISDYKLGPLIYRAKKFLQKTGNDCGTINQIINLIPVILHPLSHYEITSPIYKGDLIRIETLIPKWIEELTALDITANYKCSQLEGRNRIRIKYVISAATNHFSFYDLRTTEPICLKMNPVGIPFISKVHCFAEKCWGENNGALVPHSRKEFSNEEREHVDLNFSSLLDAYDRLHTKIIQNPAIGNFNKAANYLDTIEFLDEEGNYQPITNVMVW